MPPITAIYENGVFRPLGPIELPEGSWVEMVVTQATARSLVDGPISEGNEPLVGDELIALLDQIAALPYTSHLDGRTDVSSNHDDFLYPKHGNAP